MAMRWFGRRGPREGMGAPEGAVEARVAPVAAVIEAKKIKLSPEEARDLAKRAVKFKQERGRLPSLTSTDAWEKRMAEGVAFLARMKQEAANG